jgi:hypothetical protein
MISETPREILQGGTLIKLILFRTNVHEEEKRG